MPDLFLFYPGAENDYCGIDMYNLAGHISSAILVADILVEIEHVLRVVGAPGSGERLRAEWERFVAGRDRSTSSTRNSLGSLRDWRRCRARATR